MKISFLILVSVLASCGEIKKSGNSVGEIRTFSPVTVDQNSAGRIATICQALAQKSQVLAQALNTAHTFEVNQTDCAGAPIDSGPTEVRIQKNANGEYVFRRTSDGLDFVYPDVETATSGIMSRLCANQEQLVNPFKIENDQVVWFRATGTSSEDCRPTSDELCILLETATPEYPGSYKIHTKEWVTFRVNTLKEKLGFFSQRKTVSSSICGLNQSRQIKATLK
ncbi:MAG TPA: hypothetical protein VNJ01_02145 [Bacteriovoracaceae bacterium]|nr:hypothetical protein [Bacteriovoracaceae bacterium]